MPILSSIIEKDIAIDLGTDTTILYVAGIGIRLREPTVVTLDRTTGRVLKVGEDARKMLGRTPEAIEMVQALAKLFRLSINNGDYFLTVEQEMDYARNYLTIQQVRYKKRFKYELYIDENIKDLPCPKIIMQPLIENSL